MLYSKITLMSNLFNIIKNGSVTSPTGFRAGAVCSGIKRTPGALDLGVLYSDLPTVAAGIFTRNQFRAAPVILCETLIQNGNTKGILVNSGCANAGTGDIGYSNAVTLLKYAAEKLKIPDGSLLNASTGIIGPQLPVNMIKSGIDRLRISKEGGHDFALSIMTTDSVAKEVAVKVPEFGFTVGGCAKGSGMIHPDMATMLAFITTDADVAPDLLHKVLKNAADRSFNLISVDGDTSPNDSVLLLANGASFGNKICDATPEEKAFTAAVEYVCIFLAQSIARDGEGANKLIELKVTGAATIEDARLIIHSVLSSPLVKTAFHGSDPNWGRIIAAAGRSGAKFDFKRTSLIIGDEKLLEDGRPLQFNEKAAVSSMRKDEVVVVLDVGLGSATLTGWGCDLSSDYIKINADYTT